VIDFRESGQLIDNKIVLVKTSNIRNVGIPSPLSTADLPTFKNQRARRSHYTYGIKCQVLASSIKVLNLTSPWIVRPRTHYPLLTTHYSLPITHKLRATELIIILIETIAHAVNCFNEVFWRSHCFEFLAQTTNMYLDSVFFWRRF
jgi:hypothetical protein